MPMNHFIISLLFIFLNATCNASNKPNIILIFVDDMAYNDASSYEGDLIKTNNIDKLANGGIKFTQGYSISPVCGPSRVGLMTGTSPARYGVYWNPDMGAVQIPRDRPILPIQLKKSGYTTAIVGKWNLNNPSWDPMPSEDFFDFSYNTMVWEGDYWPDKEGNYHGVNDKNYGSSKTYGTWGPENKGDIYLTDLLTNSACDFISKHHEKPFFLYLSYNAPHSPLQGKKVHLKDLKHIELEPLKLYASMVKSIDEGVGKILNTLESNGILNETLIIFLSDNGPAITNNLKGYPEEWPDLMLTLENAPKLRGKKGDFFEGGIKVPFIAHWPDVIKKNSISHQPVYSLDIYPTLSSIANIQLPENQVFEGLDLYPIFKDNDFLLNRESMIWLGGNKMNKIAAVRINNMKFIIDKYNIEYLFDLDADPEEKNNLYKKNPDLTDYFKKILNKYSENFPSPITRRKD